MGVRSAMYQAAFNRLLSDVGVIGLVANTSRGPAVFQPGHPFPDAFPRVTLEKPQVVPRPMPCNARGWEVFIVAHCWAAPSDRPQPGGPGLVCAALADAVEASLDADLAPDGFTIVGERHFQGSREAGDPDPSIHHLVLTFGYLVNPA